MPELRHWFGLTWAEIFDMPAGERDEHVARVLDPKLPPISARYMALGKGD